MSTVRRLFDHPNNSESIDGRRVQRCCDGNAPHWDQYRIRDTDDAWSSNDSERNLPSHRVSDYLLVQDDTGASDHLTSTVRYDPYTGKTDGGNRQLRGYVGVEGPNSGYKPDFLSPIEWMNWQGCEFSSNPKGVKLADGTYSTTLPNPPRWRRTRIREDKVRWGKGVGGWGTYDITLLWCQKCETNLEKAWSDTLEVLPTIARGIAMVVSNVPVIGTAISFLINTGVSLAEGEPIDEALLDGIGGALPGQPTSGIAFRAGVSIAKGERFDQVIIDSLPIDRTVKDVLKTASDVIYGIASGENVTDVVYDVIKARMPPEAQRVMGYARRIVEGENVAEMILDEAEKEVVRKVRAVADDITKEAQNKGQEAIDNAKKEVDSLFNQYAAESGYQIALGQLTTEQRDSVSTGLVGGSMLRPKQFIGTFGSVPEKNVAANDSLEAKGQKLIASGITWRGKKVSDLIKAPTFTITVDDYDALNSVWRRVKKTYNTADIGWLRGFYVAVGLCEGMSQRGSGQLAVYQTMAEAGGRAGFDAGQAMQYERSLGFSGPFPVEQFVSAESAKENIYSLVSNLGPKPKAAPISYLTPTKPALFTDEVQERVLEKKLIERDSWVNYYLGMTRRVEPNHGMSG